MLKRETFNDYLIQLPSHKWLNQNYDEAHQTEETS